MPNTLTSAAAEVGSPVEPTTKFFDPSASLGIMQRYGMSGQARAFAEDALKSANEIDKASNFDPVDRRNDLERHDWSRTVKDREDKAYEEKKAYESTLAESVMSLSQLDIEDPEFDTKIGGFAGNPEAMKNDAVKALISMKVQQREQKGREKLQQLDYEKRFGDEIIQATGAKPEDVWKPDGHVDRDKLPTLFTAKATAKAEAERSEKQRTETLDEVGKDNAVLLDQPWESVNASRSSRAKGTIDAAAAQKIPLFKATDKDILATLDANPDMPKEAFIAQVVDLGKSIPLPEGADPTTAYLAALTNKAELPPALKPLVKSLEDTWAAHRVMMRKSPSKKTDTPASKEAPKRNSTADKYFPQ